MDEPNEQSLHWMERERRALAMPGPPRSTRSLARWSRLGFVLCAGAAVGYGWWAARGSGTPLQAWEVTREMEADSTAGIRVSEVRLEPDMNPMRALLRVARTPVGSSRLRYEVAMEDATNAVVWECGGFLGTHDEEAALVVTDTSLATFEVPREGAYHVRVRAVGNSLDDVREARIELRRNVQRVDARVLWALLITALVCLVAAVGMRRRGVPILAPLRRVA